MLLTVLVFSHIALAQTVVVQLLNGRTGKPIVKHRVYIACGDDRETVLPPLLTNALGEIQFDSAGAKAFQVSPVGVVSCGEQPVSAPIRRYSVEEVLRTGLRTQNNCGAFDPRPSPGRVLYVVRPATWLELLRN